MTTTELISYIKKQIKSNIPKDSIISKLVDAGWHIGDIEEAFLSIELESRPEVISSEIKQNNDNTEKVNTVIDSNIINKKEELIPTLIPKIIAQAPLPQNQEKSLEIQPLEIEGLREEPKIWIPRNIPIKEKEQIDSSAPNKIEIKKEEIKPATSVPRAIINSFGSVDKKESPVETSQVIIKEQPKNYLIKDLPKIAMISSYGSDLINVNNTEKVIAQKKKSKWVKLIIAFVSLIVIAGLIVAFWGGYLNLSFIKKDPKTLLLNNSKVLSSLKSYKTETNIEISSPSFASISSGLIGGEAIQSLDKDSISINTLGIINQNETESQSDNFITIKSSRLKNYITSDIKNDGSALFVSVPDLSQLIKEDVPESSVVKIQQNQFDLITSLFRVGIESQLKKINLYKVLSSGMSSYINNETLGTYDEFINKVEIISKGQDNIKGIDTYRYSIIPERQLAKKLLSKILDNFVLDLSKEDNDQLSNILGSVTVNSFEVWVGKNDNNIYQYNVALEIPLSKIINFEDKSIGDNKVNITWKSTYYDFNINNIITMPSQYTSVTTFVNGMKEVKIKNDVLSFKQLATNLHNAEGVYGNSSNKNGSCMNPTSGSLFSPTGHIKGSTTAVSSISELFNEVMKITNGVGFCYSTPNAWSFTVPIADSYDPVAVSTSGYKSYYCIDNTGVGKDLVLPPTGVVCK